MSAAVPSPSSQPIAMPLESGAVVMSQDVKARFTSEFLPRLRAWCEGRRDHVSACFVDSAAEIRVFVITASSQFDFELSDSLSDLESELGQAGWQADIVQLPLASEEMLRSFFDPSASICVYGNFGGT
jgi:hypothetical protein